jgi:hypothetical protein
MDNFWILLLTRTVQFQPRRPSLNEVARLKRLSRLGGPDLRNTQDIELGDH